METRHKTVTRKCLITGVGGFIGQKLCQRLKADGRYVYGVSLRSATPCCDKNYSIDITKPLVPRIFDGIDTVFHLAGKVHALSEIKQDNEDYFRINTDGTRHVLEAARAAGVTRFIYFSTVKAMSRDERLSQQAQDSSGELRPWTEADTIEPDTPYGRSKLEAEKLVLNGCFVPEPVVLRLCMVYGVGAKGNLTKMLRAINCGRFPPLPDFKNHRSMVHVQDVLDAALLAAQRPEAVGQVFIVSDGVGYSTRQMFELMCHALDRPVPSWIVPLWVLRSLGWTGDAIGRIRGRRFFFDSDAFALLAGSACFSSNQIETMLGFRPKWNLERALPEMVEELRRIKG